MLHPLLVDFLIDAYAEKENVVFDPFCGSGVTLLQSGINGHESIGFDINPLALLIARAKTQTYRDEKLLREFEDLKKTVYQNASPLFNDDDKIDVPKIKNRDYWYFRKQNSCKNKI